jgi:hypothetical protein
MRSVDRGLRSNRGVPFRLTFVARAYILVGFLLARPKATGVEERLD